MKQSVAYRGDAPKDCPQSCTLVFGANVGAAPSVQVTKVFDSNGDCTNSTIRKEFTLERDLAVRSMPAGKRPEAPTIIDRYRDRMPRLSRRGESRAGAAP